MGFISAIKNKLGIGGVKVKLEVPHQISREDGLVKGIVRLTSKSDQTITEVKVALEQEVSKGRGDDKETNEYTIGSVTMNDVFDIKSGEVKEIPFEFSFNIRKTNADQVQEMGGKAMGALGKMAKFANNEKSSFSITANVDVKSAVLDPLDTVDVELI